MRRHGIGFCFLALIAISTQVRADQPRDRFEQAVQIELHGGAAAASAAFALYEQAAEQGLPEAEFNLAVMLDSGRGVPRDIARAATLYARAAAHGHERAAYNLGQLYQAGDGVPTNVDLARAWFAASNLPAARSRLTGPAAAANTDLVTAPTPVSPRPELRTGSETGGIELVWTSEPQGEPTRYLVEVRAIDEAGTHEVFSGLTRVSSIFALLPDNRGKFAWRVTVILRKAGRYAPSPWVRFSLATETRVSSH